MKIDGMGEMEKMMSMMKDMNEKATSGVSELMKQAQQSADEQGAENNGTESDETKENAREAQQGVPKSGVGELMKQAQQSADEQGASSLSFPKEAMDFFNNLQKK
ncbi:hypothetical protein AB1287_17280 [Enterobacter asburiae]|uniref:hypothetical protein n=1 Tax=Scandinavium sp. UTDF21-P1B TaxID=3446379 RepID=UPI0034909981